MSVAGDDAEFEIEDDGSESPAAFVTLVLYTDNSTVSEHLV